MQSICCGVQLLCKPSQSMLCFKTNSFTTHTHTHPFHGNLSGTTQVSQYQKCKTNLHFTETREVSGSGISWAVCKSASCSRQPCQHPTTQFFLQAGHPSCHPTNSVKAPHTHTHTHTHTRLMALFPGLPRWAGTRKVKPIWIY